jgi:undecaprenyl-phosphate 4-deoxy-4-formamido-L-arabinose transferase
MELSIVVPVYNGEKTVSELFRRLKAELREELSWELLFIYDCGKDNSWAVIKNLVCENPEIVKGFKLNRNYGQHPAILLGLKEACGELIVTMDEDLQHDPLFIRELIKKQKEGNYDVVYAVFERLKQPGMRIATSEMLRKTLKHIVPGLFSGYSPFRLITYETAKKIVLLRRPYSFIDGYLGFVTYSFGQIKAKHNRRIDGVSSYSYGRLFMHAFNISVAYSPLKKWLLKTSLFFILFPIITMVALRGDYHLGFGEQILRVSIVLGATILVMALIAEIFHFRGMKNNCIPVVSETA